MPNPVLTIVASLGADRVMVEERYDFRAADCPAVMFDRSAWPWTVRTDVEYVVRRFEMPRLQAEELLA